jgi:hypothetical protein
MAKSKGMLALRIEKEIEGKFSIAEAAWGYQVNFSNLKTKKNAGWKDEPEGFGEIFLSKELDRMAINYGP